MDSKIVDDLQYKKIFYIVKEVNELIGKKLISILMLFLITPAFFPNMYAATQQATTPGDPIQGDIPEEEPSLADYIEIGYVEARFYSLELGQITAVEAYDNLPIQLTDEDGDGTLEATFGIKCRIWSWDAIPKGVLIVCGIWGPSGFTYNRPLARCIPIENAGWNNGIFRTIFRCPSDETGRYVVHIRAICFIDWGKDKGSLIISSASDGSYIDLSGEASRVNIKIEYPSGTVIANDVVEITAGNQVGEYFLHTANGETYMINDTIPTYLI